MTGAQLLEYFASMRGNGLGRAKQLAERFSLDLDRKIGELSRGNRQKVGLVQAFMSYPELLILDEPTTGLDPLLQQEFHSLVQEEVNEGRTVFISSHVLSEVEAICDRVGIIRDGELVTVEQIGDLKQRALAMVKIEFEGAVRPTDFEDIEGVSDVSVTDHTLTCYGTGAIAGEEENGTLDQLMANPISRRRVLIQKVSALLVGLFVINLALWVGLVFGALVSDFKLSASGVSQVLVSQYALAAALGLIALAVGASTGKKGIAAGVTASVGVI